jgi:hypothetical protein
MGPKDWLTVACRIIGIWLLVTVGQYAISLTCFVAGFSRPPQGYSSSSYCVRAAGDLLFAVILLVGAPLIAAMFYGDPSDPPPEDEGSRSSGDPNI